VVEFRGLNLKAGRRDEFGRLFVERALPLLWKWGFDVVAFGPAHHDDTSFFVIRAFADLAERQSMEDEFYGGDDWRKGPREAMVALIESYSDVVLELDEETVAKLRRSDEDSSPGRHLDVSAACQQ
jgi:hypothetical protein